MYLWRSGTFIVLTSQVRHTRTTSSAVRWMRCQTEDTVCKREGSFPDGLITAQWWHLDTTVEGAAAQPTPPCHTSTTQQSNRDTVRTWRPMERCRPIFLERSFPFQHSSFTSDHLTLSDSCHLLACNAKRGLVDTPEEGGRLQLLTHLRRIFFYVAESRQLPLFLFLLQLLSLLHWMMNEILPRVTRWLFLTTI